MFAYNRKCIYEIRYTPPSHNHYESTQYLSTTFFRTRAREKKHRNTRKTFYLTINFFSFSSCNFSYFFFSLQLFLSVKLVTFSIAFDIAKFQWYATTAFEIWYEYIMINAIQRLDHFIATHLRNSTETLRTHKICTGHVTLPYLCDATTLSPR